MSDRLPHSGHSNPLSTARAVSELNWAEQPGQVMTKGMAGSPRKRIGRRAARPAEYQSSSYAFDTMYLSRSTHRFEYPHSLSYQLTSLKNRPFNSIPLPASKMLECG